MNTRALSADEFFPFLLTTCLVGVLVVYNYSKGYKHFWSPLTIIAIVYAYYCCLGPYQSILLGHTHDRLTNMRKYYSPAFWGAFVSLIAYAIGFLFHGGGLKKAAVPSIHDEALFKLGRGIFLTAFALFTLSTGGNVAKLINPLDAQYVVQKGGSFANYLSLSFNFCIVGITLLFSHYLARREKLLWVAIPFLLVLGISITLGFRYRLVLLFASMAIVYFQSIKKRPNLVVLSAGLIVLVIIMGIINTARTYGAGLDTSKLEGATAETAYQSGLQDSWIFQTSGAIITLVPEKHPYAGLEPVWSTLLFPVPSKIYANKNSAKYLFDALDTVYGKKLSKGAAIMAFGEYYLAFGWVGILLGCFITGWFLRKLWNWFLGNAENRFVVVAYAVTVTFLYVLLSRGYLPQVTMLFFFTVYPAFFALRLALKKYRINEDVPESPKQVTRGIGSTDLIKPGV